MPKTFIECGTSMHSVYSTGIQRVVRNIVRESEALGPMLGLECIPVQFIAGEFREFELPKPSQVNAKKTWKHRIYFILRALYRSIKHVIPESIKNYIQEVVQEGSVLIRIKRALGLIPALPPSIRDVLKENPEDDQNGMKNNERPVLLLLDSSWNMKLWPAVAQFRKEGGRVCAVLYDLIPFTHPDTVEEHTRNAHTSWWREAPKYLDSVICISKTVREQYLDWQRENSPLNQIPAKQVEYFYLGSELRGVDPAQTIVESSIKPVTPFFLVVGSIEPRKNHAVILRAFEKLWHDGVTASLVIVGSHGWKSESLIARIHANPKFNKSLFLLRNTSDAELAALYRQAKGLIIASVAEGFGLPIVEAFQRGAKVICSDIPVFREIAGENAEYFPAEDHLELAKKIHSLIKMSRVEDENVAKRISWITWRESTEQLFRAIASTGGHDRSIQN